AREERVLRPRDLAHELPLRRDGARRRRRRRARRQCRRRGRGGVDHAARLFPYVAAQMILEAAIRRLGAIALAGIDAFGSLAGLAAHTLRRGGHRRRAGIVEQMFLIGNPPLLFVFLTLRFLRLVLVFPTCLPLRPLTPPL